MKLPYIKFYTADLLAAGRNLTAEQIGQAVLGICEQAFENETSYLPDTPREERFFDMLIQWKNESRETYQQKRVMGKKSAKKRWEKNKLSDGRYVTSAVANSMLCQTETETNTETNTETENINTLTAPADAAQGEDDFVSQSSADVGGAGHNLLAPSPLVEKKEKPKTLLQLFSNQVLERFETVVKTDKQKGVWFKRNCRCFKDILDFCEGNIPLALQTISVCARRLEKAGLSGGYDAVARNLPEYYEQAQRELQEAA